MQEFFDKGTLPAEDLRKGLREELRDKKIFPVLLSSALHNIGSDAILNFCAEILPSPAVRGTATGHKSADHKGETMDRKVAASEPLSISVFKTIADPFAGRINYFKVISGVLKNDATVLNFNRNSSERLQHIQVMQGRTATEVPELHAGDIGAVAKLKDTVTGDTLGDKNAPIYYLPARIPEPSITFAVEPKTRADEDRFGTAIHKILEEDLALRFSRDPQTKEFLLAGAGQQHIEVVVAKLRKRYHVEMTLKPPKVPYRETIRGKADAEGKHKKQTGGHGQFGLCRIKLEPLPRGKGIEFVDDVFGGAIPKNWIPSVEKGVRDSAERGFLAGFPVTDFRVSLYDGKYHDVDSSDMAFKIAGLARVQGSHEAGPPGADRAHHARRSHGAGPIFRRPHGPPQRAPRENQRQRIARRRRSHQGSRPAVGDARLRQRAYFHDSGARLLFDGVLPLRFSPAGACREGDRGAQAASCRRRGKRNGQGSHQRPLGKARQEKPVWRRCSSNAGPNSPARSASSLRALNQKADGINRKREQSAISVDRNRTSRNCKNDGGVNGVANSSVRASAPD